LRCSGTTLQRGDEVRLLGGGGEQGLIPARPLMPREGRAQAAESRHPFTPIEAEPRPHFIVKAQRDLSALVFSFVRAATLDIARIDVAR
jgi:hypothetical protein